MNKIEQLAIEVEDMPFKGWSTDINKRVAAELRRLSDVVENATKEIKRLRTENANQTAELEDLKKAMGEPVGFMNAGHIHELRQKRIPYGYVYQKEGTGAEIPLYAIPKDQS